MATKAGHHRGFFIFWLLFLVAAPVLTTAVAFMLTIKDRKSPIAYVQFLLVQLLINVGLLFLHGAVYLFVNWKELLPLLPVGDA